MTVQSLGGWRPHSFNVVGASFPHRPPSSLIPACWDPLQPSNLPPTTYNLLTTVCECDASPTNTFKS